MKSRWDARIHDGWVVSEDHAICENLLFAIQSKEDQSFELCCVKNNSFIPLGPRARVFNRIAPSTKPTVYYATEKGLCAYDLRARVEKTILPLDANRFSIDKLWFSENDDALYYVRTEWAPPLSSARVGGQPLMKKNGALVRLGTDSNTPEVIAEFKQIFGSAEISWKQNTLFATVGQSMDFELIQIDLASGKMNSLEKLQITTGLTISPRETLVTWTAWLPCIEEWLAGGRRIVLAESGHYPAFCPNMDLMAYTVGNQELWLRQASGYHERLLALVPSKGFATVDTPTWCACGKHFALTMAKSSVNKPIGVSVMVDIERKKISTTEIQNPFQVRSPIEYKLIKA